MPPGRRDDTIGGLALTDDEYTIRQSLVRNKYNVYDSDGDLVLKTKQKLFKVKEAFPFTDGDGDPVFEVKAQNLLDVAGDYTLVDADSGEPVLVLTKDFTFFHHHWTIKDADGEELATVESRSALVEALRSVSGIFDLIPHKYEITTPDGDHVGDVEGRFSVRDVYDVSIDDSESVPQSAVVAGAVAIDALEGN